MLWGIDGFRVRTARLGTETVSKGLATFTIRPVQRTSAKHGTSCTPRLIPQVRPFAELPALLQVFQVRGREIGGAEAQHSASELQVSVARRMNFFSGLLPISGFRTGMLAHNLGS